MPYCLDANVTLVGTGLHEPVELPCHMNALPPLRRVEWSFNNTSELLDSSVLDVSDHKVKLLDALILFHNVFFLGPHI